MKYAITKEFHSLQMVISQEVITDLSKKKPVHGCDEAPRGLQSALSPTRSLPPAQIEENNAFT